MRIGFRILDANGDAVTRARDETVDVADLVIAGWSGRDRAAIDEHIREMAEIGVAPPSAVPLFYRAAAHNLVAADAIQVLGPDSSGEAEAVLIETGGGTLVALGSDHTDRKLESYSIAASKQICLKPVSTEAWRLADVEDHWDDLVLRSWATIDGERVLYQEGRMDGLLLPRELFAKYTGGGARLAPGTAMLGGTMAVIGGIRPADRFEAELEDPKLGRSLHLAYDVHKLPIIA